MARTDEKVSDLPQSKPLQNNRPDYTPVLAAEGIEKAIGIIDGRWKLLILFQLFGGKVLRFSELERAIPGVSQKMLIQQLRQLEANGVVARAVYPEIPPRVEYRLTEWGQSLCPALDALLLWIETVPTPPASDRSDGASGN